MAKVALEFLARQFERVISDLATLKDDAMVVMARLDRIDATTPTRPAAPGQYARLPEDLRCAKLFS